MKLIKIIFFTLFVQFYTCSFAQNIQTELQGIFNKYKLMGMSVVGICKGKVSFSYYRGLADFGRNIPIDSNTKYRIASVSKSITAIALMQLWQQGYFDLDDDVNTHLGFSLRNPNFPSVPITYRMLLSHTASLNDGSTYDSFLNATYTQNPPPTLSQLLTPAGSSYHSSMFLNRQPGTYFTYSNVAYGVIGTLIERISGKRFDVYCKEHIFQPLGLEASFNIQDFSNINQIAAIYRRSGGAWVATADNYAGVMPAPRDLSSYTIGSNGLIFGPQGGLRISAKDLGILGMMMLNKGVYNNQRILNAQTIDLMMTPQWTFSGNNGNTYDCLFNEWGLGMHITTNRTRCDIVFSGKKMTGHPGEAYGLISDWYFHLPSGEIVVFVTNGSENTYTTSTKSAFYAVEQEVFDAVRKDFNTKCADNNQAPVVSHLEGNTDFQIFPNPTRQNLQIILPEKIRIDLKMMDSFGKNVLSKNVFAQNFVLDVSALPKGLYVLEIRSEKGLQRNKILIE
jgi:CubicO group peptidase (beta-lactamase class C family)